MSRAFSLVEILAALLVLVLGFAAVAGLFLRGLTVAARAQADSTAWTTAHTLVVDAAPLGLVPTAAGEGWLNGWYVRRQRGASDVLGPGLVSVQVTATVYDGRDGRELARESMRFLERTP
jgi:Tfp pilus assembly protein PilV